MPILYIIFIYLWHNPYLWLLEIRNGVAFVFVTDTANRFSDICLAIITSKFNGYWFFLDDLLIIFY